MFVYYKGLSKQLLTMKFDTVRSVLEKEKKDEDANEFVSAVCWRHVCILTNLAWKVFGRRTSKHFSGSEAPRCHIIGVVLPRFTYTVYFKLHGARVKHSILVSLLMWIFQIVIINFFVDILNSMFFNCLLGFERGCCS